MKSEAQCPWMSHSLQVELDEDPGRWKLKWPDMVESEATNFVLTRVDISAPCLKELNSIDRKTMDWHYRPANIEAGFDAKGGRCVRVPLLKPPGGADA